MSWTDQFCGSFYDSFPQIRITSILEKGVTYIIAPSNQKYARAGIRNTYCPFTGFWLLLKAKKIIHIQKWIEFHDYRE